MLTKNNSIKILNETEVRGQFKVTINVYLDPIIETPDHTIYSEILIQKNGLDYGAQYFPVKLNKEQVHEAFNNIFATPKIYKN